MREAGNGKCSPLPSPAGEAVARLSAMLKASSPATRFLAAKCLTQLAPALPSTSTQSYEASLFLSGLQHVSTGPGPLSSGK